MTVRELLEMQCQTSEDRIAIIKRRKNEQDETLMNCAIGYWENINDDILNLLVVEFKFNAAIPNNLLIVWCH